MPRICICQAHFLFVQITRNEIPADPGQNSIQSEFPPQCTGLSIVLSNAFQHQLPQNILSDIMSQTGATAAFAAGAYIVLLGVKAPADRKMQLVSGMRPEQGTENNPVRCAGEGRFL